MDNFITSSSSFEQTNRNFYPMSIKPVMDLAHQFRTQEEGLCSMFLIKINRGQKAFRYDVETVAHYAKKNKSLSKGADDGMKALNRNLCYELLTVAYRKTGRFGMLPEGQLVYDFKTVLYSSMPLKLQSSTIVIKSYEVNDYVKDYCGDANFSVTISQNLSSHELNIGDIGQFLEKQVLFQEDRWLRTFLEMATSQYSINNNTYTPVGAGKLFETSNSNDEEASPGIVIRSGISKGVRIVENYGEPMPALVLDVSPFYRPQRLIDIIMALKGGRFPKDNEWRGIYTYLSNIRVEVDYFPQRTFLIGRLTDVPLSQIKRKVDGREVLLLQIIQDRLGFSLEYPDLPGVIPNIVYAKNKDCEVFPIEQLRIMEDQRIPIEKMNRGLSDKLLKAGTLRPSERFFKIMKHANQMGLLNASNPVLQAFGINIEANSNNVNLGVRSCAQICYGNGQIVNPNPRTAEWSKLSQKLNYIQTKTISNWFVFCPLQHLQLIKKFVEKFMQVATEFGMKFLTKPIIQAYNEDNGETWSKRFELCLSNNLNMEFVMLIDNKAEDSHNLLKYYEALHKILTQHLTIERVQDVISGSNETLRNMINKANCKTFGLNYVPISEGVASRLRLDSNQVFVIAYDVAHPSLVSPHERRLLRTKGLTVDSFDPSVVGITANMASNPNAFVGDYFYQESRKEKVDSLQLTDRVCWILKTLADNRGNNYARPPYVFILRDGISEGQHLMAFNDELTAIRSGFKDFDINYSPKILFVIGTKRHYKKFFAFKNGELDNLSPGTVINNKFVRSDLPEFFMQSHYPLRGVGKPVEYTVICNDIGISQDELQAFLNSLCYNHQICSSAISIPEPIFQADELAKRGLNNYQTMKKLAPADIKTTSKGLVNCEEINYLLSYRYDTKNLVSTRFSA